MGVHRSRVPPPLLCGAWRPAAWYSGRCTPTRAALLFLYLRAFFLLGDLAQLFGLSVLYLDFISSLLFGKERSKHELCCHPAGNTIRPRSGRTASPGCSQSRRTGSRHPVRGGRGSGQAVRPLCTTAQSPISPGRCWESPPCRLRGPRTGSGPNCRVPGSAWHKGHAGDGPAG